ncbi:hypothetical protein QF042_004474 [Pedobacter sp. W3I1]|uniref:hypothetical protein n=1 Tax=Pedobacter sp. W3I1 TaxID=3042291 RepID=UPI00278448F5|nr:hypothetical protein [Pedobacter sp. W3I1]MDQ0640909.1 hypothetical protein [Pedobacter sp. W3I1]
MLQKLINHVYRYPKSNWKNIQRFGGLYSYYKMLKGKKEMIRSSHFLPEIISYPNGLPIYFLTGKNYLYQTLFCAHSLVKNSQQKFRFILIDDGSFDEYLINEIKQQMPNVELILNDEIELNLYKVLPKAKYPYLHYKRKVYPHIKKLTDIHTLSPDTYKLVLDSDMLFWSNPTEMITWLQDPKDCTYMLDTVESYGFDKQLMKSLCGQDIPTLLNVGIFGIDSNIINWDDLEIWSKTLEEKQSPSYFLEQALSAMLVAGKNHIVLNKAEYVVNPEGSNPNLNEVKLHHYVDISKKYYFNTAWKRFI